MPEAAPTQIDDDIEDQITEVYTGTVCVHYEEWTFLQKFKADWTITELCKEINETVQFEVPIYLVMRGVPLRADWKLTDLMNSGMHFQALPISPGECWEGPQCFKPCHCHEGFSRDRCGKCCCETSNHEGICKCNDDHHRMCSYDSEEEGSNPEDSVSEASSISSCIQIFHDKTALYARILDDQTIGDLHRLLVAANPRLADAEIFQYNSRLPRGLQIHSLRHLREIFIRELDDISRQGVPSPPDIVRVTVYKTDGFFLGDGRLIELWYEHLVAGSQMRHIYNRTCHALELGGTRTTVNDFKLHFRNSETRIEDALPNVYHMGFVIITTLRGASPCV
jgi:hypothetical protein